MIQITLKVHGVNQCEQCHHDMDNEPVLRIERRQSFDIPPQKVEVTEHQAEIKMCSHCGHVNKGHFPERIRQPTQYGPGIRSLAVYLSNYQLLPYDRISEYFSDVYSHKISQGTLVTSNQECYEILEPVEQAIRDRLCQEPVVNFDETSLRIAAKRQWLHVAGTSELTLYFPHEKRGTDAMDAMGVLPGFQGVAVHDHWKPYLTYDDCNHSLCNAHHLRELTFVHEQYGQAWAKEMIDHLLHMKKFVDRGQEAGRQNLAPATIAKYESRYSEILVEGRKQLHQLPPINKKKRGRPKRSKAENLLERLLEFQRETLGFINDFRIPFDNNQAERDGRMMKVQQKISGTFRSQQGAKRFARTRGYISTVRKNGKAVLEAIRDVFAGTPFLPNQLQQSKI